jgi:3-mercaptopyruvate sulfurtransferase SseA
MKNYQKALIYLAAVAVTIGSFWHGNRTVVPKSATMEDVQKEAGRGGYHLMQTDELFRRYQSDSGRLLLVDTRQEWEYRTGHIKGALNFPMEPTWLSRWLSRGKLKNFLGPDKNRMIVFY